MCRFPTVTIAYKYRMLIVKNMSKSISDQLKPWSNLKLYLGSQSSRCVNRIINISWHAWIYLFANKCWSLPCYMCRHINFVFHYRLWSLQMTFNAQYQYHEPQIYTRFIQVKWYMVRSSSTSWAMLLMIQFQVFRPRKQVVLILIYFS